MEFDGIQRLTFIYLIINYQNPFLMEKKNVLSQRLNTLSRTYFFDVKESAKGNPYLVVTESYKQKDKDTFTRNSLILFEDDLPKFIEVLNTVASEIGTATEAQEA